jgi:hypothetical protein
MTSAHPAAEQGPLAAALAALCAWVSAALGEGTPVRVAAPSSADGSGVDVWPLALVSDKDIRGGTARPPLRLCARFLVTAGGAADAGLGLLDLVLSAAAGDDRYRVVFEPVPAELWLVASTPPRPALLVDVPVQVPRRTPETARVRAPLQIDIAPLRTVEGRVLGPGDVPLAGMTVAAEGADRRVNTDERGRFVLSGVPAATPAVLLTGKGLRLRAELPGAEGEPLIIHCDIQEV